MLASPLSPCASELEHTFIENAQAAMLAAIEIHNKPIIAYRYPLCVLLVINAWELALKAFIVREMPHLPLVTDDGHSMPFEKCLANVQNRLATPFLASRDNVAALYEWRNKVAHYNCAPLDEVVFSLLRADVLFFCDFLKDHFNCNLVAPDNFVLLPLGFSPSIGPIRIIAQRANDDTLPVAAQEFLQSITRSIRTLNEAGVEDAILIEYDIHLVNASRAKNADLVAKIDNENPDAATLHVERTLAGVRLSDSPDAPEVRLSQQNERFNEFQMTHKKLMEEANQRYSDFRRDKKFNALLALLKENPNCCQKSFLNPVERTGTPQCFYGGLIWKELDKSYTIRFDSHR